MLASAQPPSSSPPLQSRPCALELHRCPHRACPAPAAPPCPAPLCPSSTTEQASAVPCILTSSSTENPHRRLITLRRRSSSSRNPNPNRVSGFPQIASLLFRSLVRHARVSFSYLNCLLPRVSHLLGILYLFVYPIYSIMQ